MDKRDFSGNFRLASSKLLYALPVYYVDMLLILLWSNLDFVHSGITQGIFQLDQQDLPGCHFSTFKIHVFTRCFSRRRTATKKADVALPVSSFSLNNVKSTKPNSSSTTSIDGKLRQRPEIKAEELDNSFYSFSKLYTFGRESLSLTPFMSQ